MRLHNPSKIGVETATYGKLESPKKAGEYVGCLLSSSGPKSAHASTFLSRSPFLVQSAECTQEDTVTNAKVDPTPIMAIIGHSLAFCNTVCLYSDPERMLPSHTELCSGVQAFELQSSDTTLRTTQSMYYWTRHQESALTAPSGFNTVAGH